MPIFNGQSSPWGKMVLTVLHLSGGISPNLNKTALCKNDEIGGKNVEQIYTRYSHDL